MRVQFGVRNMVWSMYGFVSHRITEIQGFLPTSIHVHVLEGDRVLSQGLTQHSRHNHIWSFPVVGMNHRLLSIGMYSCSCPAWAFYVTAVNMTTHIIKRFWRFMNSSDAYKI